MHSYRLKLATGLAAVAALISAVVVADRAIADGTADAWNEVERIGAEATSPGGTNDAVNRRPRSNTRRTSSAPPCKYEVPSQEVQDNAAHMAANGWADGPKAGDNRPGRWLRKICGQDATSAGTATMIWVPQRADPEVLAQRAVENADLPVPSVVTSPSADQPLVVNLPTWLSVDSSVWAPVDVSATAGGVTVSATAVPDRVVWNLGNSEQIVCDGPGTRYDPSRPAAEQQPTCSYTYTQPGAYQITATVEWRVTWQAVGAPGGGDLGTARRSTTVPVNVAEIQAVNQNPRQGG